ncbi:MAG: LysR family transcriptional regulator [Nannocystaceae bacterium]|nr:LysR family transcriptional regulator [Nannocystaceae bacterium]
MFDELRYFVAIVEAGTYRRAAQRLHLTQPALSAAVTRLEATVGARILDRGRRGASVTAAGGALLPHARAALAAVEAGIRAVAEIEGLRDGEVRLAAGATACTYLLPSILSHYRDAHPGIRFLLREASADEALENLHAGDIDIAVTTSADGEPWYTDELILVRAPDFERPRDVARAPFVTFGRRSTSRALLDGLFPDADVVMELGSIAAVKGNVRAGIGIALVSRHAVQRDLAQGLLVHVPHRGTPVKRLLSLVHLGVSRLPPAAAALRKLLLSAEGKPTFRT